MSVYRTIGPLVDILINPSACHWKTLIQTNKEGRALTGFSGPPKIEKIKVAAQHFILRVLIDE